MHRWSPWRAASKLPNLSIRLARLPDETGGGVLARKGDQVVIVLDRRLSSVERRVMLTHELVHHERGSSSRCHDTGYLSPHVVHEERAVEREVARRLVPAGELEAFIDRQERLDVGVDAQLVAEEFEVTERVGTLALRMLKLTRARRPS